MDERAPHDFMYEHCDVPQGESLAEWRARAAPPARRRAQVASGALAALATRAPIALPVRGSRRRP